MTRDNEKANFVESIGYSRLALRSDLLSRRLHVRISLAAYLSTLVCKYWIKSMQEPLAQCRWLAEELRGIFRVGVAENMQSAPSFFANLKCRSLLETSVQLRGLRLKSVWGDTSNHNLLPRDWHTGPLYTRNELLSIIYHNLSSS